MAKKEKSIASTRNREGWHSRTISEIVARLSFLDKLVVISPHKEKSPGADIEIKFRNSRKRINIEVQQDVSGANWPKTVESWSKRHGLYTFVVFTEPFAERIRSTIAKYPFFQQRDVFLFSEMQLSEMVAVVGAVVIIS